MPELSPRAKQLIKVVERFEPQGKISGAEVGVGVGRTSAALLARFPNLSLLMIDSWLAHGIETEYWRSGDPCARMTKKQQDDNCDKAIAAVAFAARHGFKIVRDTSESAARLQLALLDFVFIDADHTYIGVLTDCRRWWPKVRAGGVLCGHDWNNWSEHTSGVTPAVRQFAKGQVLEVQSGEGNVWWIEKPSS